MVSLTNLSLSCYPEKISYVDQVLSYAKDKVIEHSDSSDLHSPTATSNLLALLLAPIANYTSVLTLLALVNYAPLLTLQPFSTRRAISQAVVSSVLKNETIIETPEEVNGVLDLMDVLIRDQKDAPGAGPGVVSPVSSTSYGRGRKAEREYSSIELEELAEEQGWLARMIHLFRSDDPDRQFLLLSAARKQFGEGGERIRYTFPPLVVSAVKLARRYKVLEGQVCTTFSC